VLLDTNIYTTPVRYGNERLGILGVQLADRYEDVLSIFAIRLGCGEKAADWQRLKKSILDKATAVGATLRPARSRRCGRPRSTPT